MPELDFEPGERLKGAFQSAGGRVDAVVGSRDFANVDMPDEPGPAALGREPVVGTFRRQRDMPVLRDELAEMVLD